MKQLINIINTRKDIIIRFTLVKILLWPVIINNIINSGNHINP